MVNPNCAAGTPRLGFDGQTCLDCGASMRETLRWQQGNMLFIWFECKQQNCSGKFLRKASLAASLTLKPVRPVTSAAMRA